MTARAVPTEGERATYTRTLTAVRASLVEQSRQLGCFASLPALCDETRSACIAARTSVSDVLASVNREIRGQSR